MSLKDAATPNRSRICTNSILLSEQLSLTAVRCGLRAASVYRGSRYDAYRCRLFFFFSFLCETHSVLCELHFWRLQTMYFRPASL